MHERLTIDPGRAALLLVDLQEEQRQDPVYSVEGIDDVLGNARRLLLGARERGLAVIHAAYVRDFAKRPPRPFEPRAADGAATFSDSRSPLTQICREVAPADGEPVIVKNDASAFSEGDLDPFLSQAGIEWLIVAGVWTEACVAATVRDAMASGFRVLLVKDACGSATAAMHQTGVLNLANRLYGGAVADTERALVLMAGKKAEVWIAERPAPIAFTYADAGAAYDAL
ncbi:MAG: isochorismatase family protein [Parvibaculaceae bacterium]